MNNVYGRIWEKLYKVYFKLTFDFSEVYIPQKPSEGKWYLVIITDVLSEILYGREGTVFIGEDVLIGDLDQENIKNERDASKGPYAIWVRSGIEADKAFWNCSARGVEVAGVTSETFHERMIHGFFREKAGLLLDQNSITLCAGTRLQNDRTLMVYSRRGKTIVQACTVDGYHETMRIRQVIA